MANSMNWVPLFLQCLDNALNVHLSGGFKGNATFYIVKEVHQVLRIVQPDIVNLLLLGTAREYSIDPFTEEF